MFASIKSSSQLRNECVFCIKCSLNTAQLVLKTEIKVDSGTIPDAILTLISIKVLN